MLNGGTWSDRVGKKPPIKQLQPLTVQPSTAKSSLRLFLDEKMPFSEDDMNEFKLSFHSEKLDLYRRTMNAFLNTRGGTLFFGVDDSGMVKGITCRAGKRKNKVEAEVVEKGIDRFKLFVDQTIRRCFTPAIYNVKVEIYKLTRDLSVWAIIVPPSPVPVTYQNKFYCRLNASTVLTNTVTKADPVNTTSIDAIASTVENVDPVKNEFLVAMNEHWRRNNSLNEELKVNKLKENELIAALNEQVRRNNSLQNELKALQETMTTQLKQNDFKIATLLNQVNVSETRLSAFEQQNMCLDNMVQALFRRLNGK